MLNIQTLESGNILIEGDEELLANIDGQDLSDVDVSDLKLDAQTVALQYSTATSTPITEIKDDEGNVIETLDYDEAKRYAVLKQKYLDMYNPKDAK